MPQANSELMQLRPIGGSEDQICAVYQQLKELDPITSAEFPSPQPSDNRRSNFISTSARCCTVEFTGWGESISVFG